MLILLCVFEGDVEFDRLNTAAWASHLPAVWPTAKTSSLAKPSEPLQINLFGEYTVYIYYIYIYRERERERLYRRRPQT